MAFVPSGYNPAFVPFNEMKLWLLKQKQTQNWPTTKATADACYALLLSGSQWLTSQPQVTIQLGSEVIKSSDRQQQAGTGYFKAGYKGGAIQPAMGSISRMPMILPHCSACMPRSSPRTAQGRRLWSGNITTA